MKFTVVRYLKNGNIEGDDQLFNTEEQAQGWADYTWANLTAAERAQYRAFEAIETETPTLKEIREEHGLTRKQAAELVGVPIRTWEKWETGEREPAPYLEKLIAYYIEHEAN